MKQSIHDKYYKHYLRNNYNLKRMTLDRKEEENTKESIKKLLVKEFDKKREMNYSYK